MANHNPGKHPPWRRDPLILERLPKVERLRLQGLPNTRIAAQLGVAENTIRRDCERLDELWRERTQGEQAEMRAVIVAKLEDTRLRAIEAAEWDRQCEEAVLFGLEIEHPVHGTLKVYRDEKDRAEFRSQKAQSLNVARQAAMDEAKVLGVVPDKLDVGGEVLVRVVELEREPEAANGSRDT